MNQHSKPVSPQAPPVTITPTPPPDTAIGYAGNDFSINNLKPDKGVWLLVDGFSLFIQLLDNRIDVDAYPRNGMGVPLATLTVNHDQLPSPDAMDDSGLGANSSPVPADVSSQIDQDKGPTEMLFRTHLEIWTDYDPRCLDNERLARESDSGDAIYTSRTTQRRPANECDRPDFFPQLTDERDRASQG